MFEQIKKYTKQIAYFFCVFATVMIVVYCVVLYLDYDQEAADQEFIHLMNELYPEEQFLVWDFPTEFAPRQSRFPLARPSIVLGSAVDR
jgi:hypothetical protein